MKASVLGGHLGCHCDLIDVISCWNNCNDKSDSL